MAKQIEELRVAITKSRVGQSRWRCPVPLRDEIVGYAKARRHSGASVLRIARELGVSETGLTRWLQIESGTLRRVRVQASSASTPTKLALITPGGYRLEGLSTSSAAELLRRLGC